ncbi:ABC transporter substrate-binding protein [Kutzneria kofuensis]|uniref:Peptide/nickel transport system substrate-binding protein n=1 Tax=Kutzneria kofuensis TaxID=103725 RepID=A0A7W9NJ77_9PSEU|nr:ABC transporter substrate-binding protein [Kutzneria kofuensis]MBB5894339.1 peptide/nickel transport system substrate-binding protein [Kutzneria kofuensis]
MRRLLLPVSLLTAAVVVAACTGEPAPSRPGGTVDDNTTMTLADSAEPSTLNPVQGFAPQGGSRMYDGLVGYTADRTLRPVLATELPQPSADGRSWTVKLHQKVRFSDGSLLTAADVVTEYNAVLNPAVKSPLRPDFDMLTGVTAVDELTVRFDLAFPFPSFPTRLVLGIVPHTATPADPQPPGTGAYAVTTWDKGKQLVLGLNKYYYGVPPKVVKVTVAFVSDDAKRIERMRNGDFDGIEVPPDEAVAVAKFDGVKVITEDTADYRAVTLPSSNPVTADRSVRLALNFAVDRKDLIGTALGGKGTPAYTPMPDSLPEFVDPQATYRFDRSAAGRILDQAGWLAGTDGIRSKDGVRAAFTVGYPAGDLERRAIAQAFAKQLRAVGFDVTATQDAGPDAVQIVSGGNPFDPGLAIRSVLRTGGSANTTGYTNPGVDTALDAAHKATDPAARATAFRSAQRAYIGDPSLVTLAFVTHTYAIHDNWSGSVPITEPSVHGPLTWGPWWNMETWTVR